MEAPRGERDNGQDAFRLRRRGLIGAGLAGAGTVLLSAAGAGVQAPPAAGASPQVPRRNRQSTVPSGAKATSGPYAQLPLRPFYPDLPAIPVDLTGMAETLARLVVRGEQVKQAKQGLTQVFTINGQKRPAYAFLFKGTTAAAEHEDWQALEQLLRDDPERALGELQDNLGRLRDTDPPTGPATQPLSLESPRQFSISWTTFPDVYGSGLPSLSTWASSLTDADAATQQFWPMIAEHGFGYNLIIPERVSGARVQEVRQQFGSAWSGRLGAAQAAGNLYVIDMSRFEALEAQTVRGAPRFTPGTITLLTRNPRTKTLTPVSIIVSGQGGSGRTTFSRATSSDDAWLYALQAAKTSITVFGVWLGHVYHWHIVTTAMQMAMFNTLPTTHPIYQLLAPQSNYAIAFDDVLLALWSQIAPPTSLATPESFLTLTNDYATGRSFFDDDPRQTINQLGLRRRDFSQNAPWDQYPVVQRLLAIWDLVAPYVSTFVNATYSSDAAVANDADLQRWIATAASSDPISGGNIRGLPQMSSRAALQSVLTSLLYRITVHGISRLNSTSNPALTFTANYPHCLQRTDIPGPRARIGTKQLLQYLPNTDTIGQAVTFYFTFAFSTPYEPFIPLDGVGTELFFPGGPQEQRNQALIELRRGLASFINGYQPDMPSRFQWPLNIET